MMDKIFIRDLLVRGIVGINPEERVNKQDIVVNIEMDVCMKQPGLSDHIDDAVNYRTITKDVIKIIEKTQYFLIEKLSAHIAEYILRYFAVSEVKVSIDKPGALRFCESVAVQITRRKEDILNDVYLLIGSNIDKEVNIQKAYEILSKKSQIIHRSSVYETLAIDAKGQVSDQDAYYNMAYHIRTPLLLDEVKKELCLDVEAQLNRERGSDKFMPRTIDVDIVLYNSDVYDSADMTVPDPDLLEFEHALIPVSEIAPYYIHPNKGESLLTLSKPFLQSTRLKKVPFSFDENESKTRINELITA